MAERRRTGLVNQRTLGVEPEGPPVSPVASEADPTTDSPSTPPPAFREVVSSSDALWERRLRWLRTREQFESHSSTDAAPQVEK
ncbi:MAG TPA: hypothetical protein VK424_06915 [Thermoplasmata archaeon]|nr:hypothetical protein [Thermoplasmata archaeon]